MTIQFAIYYSNFKPSLEARLDPKCSRLNINRFNYNRLDYVNHLLKHSVENYNSRQKISVTTVKVGGILNIVRSISKPFILTPFADSNSYLGTPYLRENFPVEK